MNGDRIRRFVALREKLASVARADVAAADAHLRESQETLRSSELALDKASSDLASSDELTLPDLELHAHIIRDAEDSRRRATEARDEAARALAASEARRLERERDRRGLEIVRDKVVHRERMEEERALARIDDDRAGAVFDRVRRGER